MFLDTISLLATAIRVAAILLLCNLTQDVDNLLDRTEARGQSFFARGAVGLVSCAALRTARVVWRRLGAPFRPTAVRTPVLPLKPPCGCGQ